MHWAPRAVPCAHCRIAHLEGCVLYVQSIVRLLYCGGIKGTLSWPKNVFLVSLMVLQQVISTCF